MDDGFLPDNEQHEVVSLCPSVCQYPLKPGNTYTGLGSWEIYFSWTCLQDYSCGDYSSFPINEGLKKNLPSWADLKPFMGQVQEILKLVNVMEGSNLMPQLAKKETYLFRFFSWHI